MQSMSNGVFGSILILIYVRFGLCAFKPAVFLSKRNGEFVTENVFITYFECTSENFSSIQIQDAHEVMKLKEQLANMNRSMEAVTAEILKMKQDISAIVRDQLKAKDLMKMRETLIKKNANMTFQLPNTEKEPRNSYNRSESNSRIAFIHFPSWLLLKFYGVNAFLFRKKR